jgi:hypothetical protein
MSEKKRKNFTSQYKTKVPPDAVRGVQWTRGTGCCEYFFLPARLIGRTIHKSTPGTMWPCHLGSNDRAAGFAALVVTRVGKTHCVGYQGGGDGMAAENRDDFPVKTKRVLALRANHRCSLCNTTTSGPSEESPSVD